MKETAKDLKVMERIDYYKVPFVGTVLLSVILAVVLATLYGMQQLVNWGNTHRVLTQNPVEVKFKPLVVVEKIEPEVVISPVIVEASNIELETDIEKYICKKFGDLDCKIALAIAKAESGLRENAININTNGTIDVGIYQINSIHFNKEGCTLKEVSDMYKNVDCAYSIWKEQGWTPWVAYLNNSYMEKL